MSFIRSIQLAIELATSQRDDLAKALAATQRNVDFAHQQMSQLEGYAADTDAKWTHSAATQMTSELVLHHYQFMARLQQAIAMQATVITNACKEQEDARQRLLQAEFRLSGLKQVMSARQIEMLQIQKRREQRQTDEFAAMLHTRNLALLANGELP
jgi:flagellar FliJ protein